MSSTVSADEAPNRPRWPWFVLGLALIWSAALRIPLILNAELHIDSDLAVDGLTLLEAVQGHWRWHYPGTPSIGTIPVLLSWPQAMVWGTNSSTLVSGGTVAYLGLIVATFLLAWRAFGPRVAAWSLIPLTFASTGAIWLSGRITGGHLLTAVWHAGAFYFLHPCLARGGLRPVLILGLWCGLGLYVDSMFVVTLAGLIPAMLAGGWALNKEAKPVLASAGASLTSAEWEAGRKPVPGATTEKVRRLLVSVLVFLLAFMAGMAPRLVGNQLDPYDAYPDQFHATTSPELLLAHTRMLALECLPRLIIGHRLPELQSDPHPMALGRTRHMVAEGEGRLETKVLTVLLLSLFLAAIVVLAQTAWTRPDIPARSIALGLIVSTVVTLLAFVANRNIFNVDNYRYLVDLLVPWSLGFGLAFHQRARLNRAELVLASLGALAVAGLMTLDAARWYSRFGWIDERGVPARNSNPDYALKWLNAHPDVHDLYGGYWDVYRLAFLTGGRVKGIPFPNAPNRFPEWSLNLPGGHPHTIMVRTRSLEGETFRRQAMRAGGRILDGEAVWPRFMSWP
jgi:hypothetical protein